MAFRVLALFIRRRFWGYFHREGFAAVYRGFAIGYGQCNMSPADSKSGYLGRRRFGFVLLALKPMSI